jgi:O-antigen ligase
MLAAPFVTPLLVASPQLVESVPLSWAHRIAIWRYTCARIMEQPWIGHGIDSGRMTTDMLTIRGLVTRGIPVHPHSASLQIWHDLGLVGALLAAALLLYGGWRLLKHFAQDKFGAAATAAVLAMFGLMANVGWSVWQEWWMATLLLTAALIAALGVRAARA